MVRPKAFRFNDQTAVNNYYQVNQVADNQASDSETAMKEFNALVQVLETCGIQVEIISPPDELDVPDAVFPNNWISFHTGKRYGLYSMFAPNRRLERELLQSIPGISEYQEAFSFVEMEEHHRFLEGTGSLVLDRINKVAYAAISDRTDAELAEKFGKHLGFRVITFSANQTTDGKRLPIYHTNVMMSIGTGFAVLCDSCIDDAFERKTVLEELKATGREIIVISENQTASFAGNILELRNEADVKFIVMSDQALSSLDSMQVAALSRHGKIVHSDIRTIETLGGGSARCMIAELFS